MNKRTLSAPQCHLDLAFKGGRDYLHGSDIFEAMIALSGAHQNILLELHGPAVKALEVYRAGDIPPKHPRQRAIFKHDAGNEQEVFYLLESENIHVTSRYASDERKMTTNAQLSEDRIVCNLQSSFRSIETVNALNKMLLDNVLGVNGIKWFMTRLIMPEPRSADRLIELKLLSRVGTRLIRTSFSFDGTEAGEIFFSGVVTK